MKTFLLDLWHDLREKRLGAVAVALLAGVVAVPFVLAKPAEEPPPPVAQQPVDQADKREAALAVKALDPSAIPASDLDTYSSKDPFKPLVKPRGTDVPDGGSTGTGAGLGSSAGGESVTDDETGGSGGGSTEVTVETEPGTGETGSGKTTTTQYAYVADVTFESGNRTRRIKGLERLEMLPSEASPLLIFMGVSSNAGNAVFLVDSSLKAAGEGKCKPSASDCAFVYIGPGAEHQFTNEDGESFGLRVDEIRRVKVDGKAKGSSRRRKGAKAGAADERRRFVPPILTDLVTVATGAGR
jgi:hypothetical protein